MFVECAVNEVCSERGACEALEEQALYGAPCGSTVDCSAGLLCANHRCVICSERHLSTFGRYARSAAERASLPKYVCVDGRYVTKERADRMLTRQPRLMFALLLVVVATACPLRWKQ